MFKIDNSIVQKNMESYIVRYEKATKVSLSYDSYVNEANYKILKEYDKVYSLPSLVYPRELRIAKSIDKLQQGDLTPEKIIKIDKQPERHFYKKIETNEIDEETGEKKIVYERTERVVPIWFGDSRKGVYLRFGYENGDKRYLSRYMLGDNTVHMALGGSTGQGKSVTMNNIIFNICEEYAPWEVKLTLVDAKIVEFKKYALHTPMPHIASVVATEDTDYLISVLFSLEEEMLNLNKAFATIGVDKIEDFRNKTNLCIPQNIIIIDEFQTMFKYAGKKLNKLVSCLDSFARLGRNTGYHLLLASQELGSDIPKGTLANITLRGALGCATPEVSSTLIGNDQATRYLGKKGNILINDNPASGKVENNTHYVIPFLQAGFKDTNGKEIIRVGNKYDFKYNLNFYDEAERVNESKYLEYINSFTRDENTIVLGMPSFVTKEEEKVVKIKFTGDDYENVCIIANIATDCKRFFKILQYNITTTVGSNLILCCDDKFKKMTECENMVSYNHFFSINSYDNNKFFSIAYTNINHRRIMKTADEVVFNSHINIKIDDDIRDLFYKTFIKGSEFDTEIMLKRFAKIVDLMLNDTNYITLFKIDTFKNIEDKKSAVVGITNIIINKYKQYDIMNEQATFNKFPLINCWILGLDKLRGIGRNSVGRKITEFKDVMLDCCQVGVRFYIFTKSICECGELTSSIRYYLLDHVSLKETTKIKCENFPQQKSAVLAVLFDSQAESEDVSTLKFKKMTFDDEIL